jgi:hypothetical protein
MAGGIDQYTKLLLHCNGVDGSASFIDDEITPKSVTAYGNAQIDTTQSKFGGASGLFNGVGDYLTLADSTDWDFGTGDFTIDFWVRFNSLPSLGTDRWIITQSDLNFKSFGVRLLNESSIYKWNFFTYNSGFEINIKKTTTVNIDTWYHIAVIRNGNGFYIFQDGTQIGTTDVDSRSIPSITGYLYIADHGLGTINLDGYLDELRISNGIARSTSNFTPPISEYSTPQEIDETISLSDSFILQINPESQLLDDSLGLSDDWNLQVNPNSQEINELLSLSEDWDIHISNEELGIDESLDLSDNWSVLINPESQILSETLSLSESWVINAFGTYYAKLRTDFRWLQTVVASISTSFSWLKAKFLNTDFRWLGNVNKSISTDFRWIAQPYTALTPISYTDIQIFINSVDVFLGNDVDLQSGNITHTIGNTSTASFVLARKHDDLDRTHLGVASQITNQNSVQIYIKGHLEFDGYISGISVDSESETVSISAKMDEPEDNRHSIELPLPSVNEKLHLYHCLVNNVQIDNPKEDTRSVIVGSNSRYWSGSAWVFYIEDALIFATDALAEAYIDALLLSEESITNEFDRIFTKKSPSVTSRERNPQYYKGVKASLGTKITQQIDKYRLLEYITAGKGYYAQQIEDGTFNTKPNYSYFWAVLAKNALTGIYNGDYRYIGTSLASTTTDLWILNGVVPMYQRIKDNLEEELGYYYVGSAPFKEISPKNGWLIPAQKWEDRNDGLYNVLEEAYDYRAYAQRVADLEYEKLKNVHGDILPVTSANLEVTFDGYYFYDVKLLTRINVTNTTVANTYKNLNGFPVSVKTININFSSMKITLGCDNRLSQKEIDEIDEQMPDEESPSYLTQESAVRVYRKFDLKTWKFVS